MNIQIVDKKLSQIKADLEVVFVLGKKLKHKWVKDLALLGEQGFKGGDGEVVYLPHKKKLYIGIASEKHNDLREAAALCVQVLKKKKVRSVKLGLYYDKLPETGVKAITEGLILGAYNFNKYKSKKDKLSLNKLIISTEAYGGKIEDVNKLQNALDEGRIIAEATNYTRDIVNQTPSDITPLKLTEIAEELVKDKKLEIIVYGEKYLEKEGMGAFLAVSKASPYPPQLIHVKHKPDNPKAKIILVGKGVTYDTGGLSLKPSEGMRTMKSDKGGASAVLGIMQAVSRLNLPCEVHGIIGAVENAIGRHAYKPDDVLTAKNGKTIEVKNTDAEGRLVLADCLVYAQELKPDYIIDLATLTGACVVALGEYTIGVMGNNNEFKKNIIAAGGKSGEFTAELPFNKYLAELLKSDVADISNISSGRWGGAITAALFLDEFIDKKNKDKWVHLDIAGPAFVEKPWGYNPYGASGAGVRLIVEWIKSL
ncbi:leucyl aminopeptidase [Candidatus Falkowbacteria bacterium]|nr:MAG: leucyl aminopeptidase [Candidatus Falkowbacteria bacterium]